MLPTHTFFDLSFKIAPTNWGHNSPNPYTKDGKYSPNESCYVIRDIYDDSCIYGRGKFGLFGVTVGRLHANLPDSLSDFISYENAHSRQPIISYPNDINIYDIIKNSIATTQNKNTIRQYDPQWIVHSTTSEAWQSIKNCEALLSLKRLENKKMAIKNLGMELLGEPEDYANYIMFGNIDAFETELIVASHLASELISSQDSIYTPGARLYFDAHSIIKDGLAIRDGLHVIKVYDYLKLQPYLVAAIDITDVDPNSSITKWTPRRFYNEANRLFYQMRECF